MMYNNYGTKELLRYIAPSFTYLVHVTMVFTQHHAATRRYVNIVVTTIISYLRTG